MIEHQQTANEVAYQTQLRKMSTEDRCRAVCAEVILTAVTDIKKYGKTKFKERGGWKLPQDQVQRNKIIYRDKRRQDLEQAILFVFHSRSLDYYCQRCGSVAAETIRQACRQHLSKERLQKLENGHEQARTA